MSGSHQPGEFPKSANVYFIICSSESDFHLYLVVHFRFGNGEIRTSMEISVTTELNTKYNKFSCIFVKLRFPLKATLGMFLQRL